MMTTGMLITGQNGAITTVRSQIAATIAAHALTCAIKKNIQQIPTGILITAGALRGADALRGATALTATGALVSATVRVSITRIAHSISNLLCI